MSKDEQVLKLLKLAKALNDALSEDGIMQDTLGINSKLSIHLDDVTFASLARESKQPVEADYMQASFHGRITIGNVEFVVCHNLT